MYMWCVHCVLLDERISSEDIFRGGGNYRCRLCLVWMLKMCSCSSKWQCLCLSESITVLFCSRDVAVVVSGVCASESVSKMWMVYLFVYLHNVIWISLCAKVLCACTYVCSCVIVYHPSQLQSAYLLWAVCPPPSYKMMSIMTYTADLSVQLLKTIDRHKFHTAFTLGLFSH